MNYPHIAARIFNTPLLIHPQKLDAMIAGIGPRLLGVPVILEPSQATDAPIAPQMFSTRKGERADRGYSVVDGVAVLGINGALVHRTRFDMADSSLMLGYNDLSADLEDAMANSDVHAVLQVYQSPGGEVSGAFEYAQRIFDMRGKKPMQSIADSMAASAAFLGASAADQVAVSSTGYAGSIGVVMRHVDFSRALANDGINVTHIFAGAHKVDGNPFEALPASVRADLQGEINNLYAMFTEAVAKHLGITAEHARGTEARTFMGQAAVDAGLAHRVATTDQLITELAGLRARSYPVGQSARSTQATDKGATMSGTTTAADTPTATLPATAAAPASAQADTDRAVQAERARTTGILNHAEAKGRTALAHQCVASGLSVEAAGAILAAAPKDAGAAQPFAAAMTAIGNPAVNGTESPPALDAESPQVIAGSWDKAFGIKSA
ncbi:MAG: S49 family peptidase [Ramlibacter sp.]|nr:S49 family peptidase [Ramlibacter sp.]